MTLFSQRHNIVPKNAILLNGINHHIRTGIWNAFYKNYFPARPKISLLFPWDVELFDEIWCNFIKNPVNEKPEYRSEYFGKIELFFLSHVGDYYDWAWWKIFDFIEFISEKDGDSNRKSQFYSDCNKALERESSGYRIINGLVSPITSEQEINEIEHAILESSNQVQTHLQQALLLLSDRKSPSFRNSIKESISAVEAQCKLICEEPTATLTKSLEIIQRRNIVKVHPFLIDAFKKIYSWTNDDGGIRHALTDETNLDREDAQFMLIACSAFINYLLVKKQKQSNNTQK